MGAKCEECRRVDDGIARCDSGERTTQHRGTRSNACNPRLGHTVEIHVGKSEAWLRKRLETDPSLRNQNYASSFFNEAAANRAQGRFVSILSTNTFTSSASNRTAKSPPRSRYRLRRGEF
ncbi:MAG: hypothetical protein M3458_11170 [Acidobacteriota bacterium]|nr:hypothetical protein [Acidobacteriota bacterium]